MGAALHAGDARFRLHFDAAAAAVAARMGPAGAGRLALAALGPATAAEEDAAAALLKDARVSQPAIFCVQYALAEAGAAKQKKGGASVSFP